MKRLLALLMCLALLSAAALAEVNTLPCTRITADSIVITVGEQSFEPDLTAVVDAANAADGELLTFHLSHGGNTLLPIQAKRNENGIAVMLDDSQVYLLSPELLDESSDISGNLGMFLGANIKSLPELGFGVIDFLDAQPEDEFLLDMPLLTEWLAADPGVDPSTPDVLADIQLPEIRVKRETAKYTLTVDGEKPLLLYLTHDERMVSLKCSDAFFSAGMQVYTDGGVQAAVQTSAIYSRATDESLMLKLQYTPADDGSAKLSITMEYDDAWIYSNWGRIFLSVNGTSGTDRTGEYKIQFSDDNHLLGVPLGARCTLRIEYANVTDCIKGKSVQTVGKDIDDSMMNLTFALMGMLGDVEKLTTDPTIAGIFEAVSALQMEYYGATFPGSPTV